MNHCLVSDDRSYNNNNNDIYPGNPLALAVFSGAMVFSGAIRPPFAGSVIQL